MKKGGVGVAKKTYSVLPADYRLLQEVGLGASATVYRAMYIPYNEIVAVKCLDLDRINSNLDDIRREAQTMSLIDHPNVVKGYCSFVVEHSLWVIMPFMAEGSCLHLMKVAYPDGFEEHIIGSLLKETLKALEYLHKHGHIHRDVKAGNILLDSSGVVKLSDFGVTAYMFDKGDRLRSRNTFVGTPCWMAPEVLQPGGGYDFKADIWSFGITALELAHGHAPFSKYPPMKVLLMTLQNAPPGLDYDRDKKFSKSFKEMVAMCLVKDQTKRPTAEKLLKHSFFKNTKPPELYVKSILSDLPPLWDRVKALQLKDAAQLALKKMPSSEQEALSQSEYQRGVSAWNFDIEDLKVQASLIQDDDDDLAVAKENDGSLKNSIKNKDLSTSSPTLGKPLAADEIAYRKSLSDAEGSDVGSLIKNDEFVETSSLDSSNQGGLDKHEKIRSTIDSMPSISIQDFDSRWKCEALKKERTFSGPVMLSTAQNNSSERTRNGSESQFLSEISRREPRKAPNLSGPLMLPNRASRNCLSAPIQSFGGYGESSDDKSRANVVQIKGRFSVTSENVDLGKDIPLGAVPWKSSQDSLIRRSASVGDSMVNSKQVPVNQHQKANVNTSLPASVLMPHLENLFQQTSFQQDLLTNLLNSFQQNDILATLQAGLPSQTCSLENDVLIKTAVTEREQILLVKILELQTRIIGLTDDLTAERVKCLQLQQQLSAFYSQEDQREEIQKKPELPSQ
ncbi:hypothetical protein HPP92_022018 [Vanilla planifolia]|uniref:Protein kinase domain-containing protein n=1 Tax=Vanilla planifolia TaxID=51239 RepID=A0A835UF89_VANPL|nr:hypothetical protein HPP92_022018 [Vanilla planifolia]